MKYKTKPICIRLPEKWIEYLKNKSRELSYKHKKDMGFHDLIRNSISKQYADIEK